MNNTIARYIVDNIDIVSVISQRVKLKKHGVNYIGLCPFHQEKTPSFNVNSVKRLYYCFGCHVGGDVLSYIMGINSISFVDAIKLCINEYGLSEELYSGEELKKINEEKIAIDKCCDLINKFHKDIVKSKELVSYLEKRKINYGTLKKFNLGYCEAGAYAEKHDYIGINDIYRYDKRLIIPITNEYGKHVAVAGRALFVEQPKYINSYNNILYTKNDTLFGLYDAKEEIRLKDECIVVEGYFDFFKMYQSGTKNVVACCSSTLTNNQALKIKKYTNNIKLLFDGDNAGHSATLNAIEVCLENDLNCSVIKIALGLDPDSYIDVNGIDSFNMLISKSMTIVDFMLLHYIALYELQSNKRKLIFDKIFNVISKCKSDIKKNDYIKELNIKLGVNNALCNNMQQVKESNYDEYLYTIEGSLIHSFFYYYDMFISIKDNFDKKIFKNKLSLDLINVLYYEYDGIHYEGSNKLIIMMISVEPEHKIDIQKIINKLVLIDKKYNK